MEMLLGLPDVTAMNSFLAASASGVSMKSAVFTLARGPTLYHPFSVPSSFRKGNFMYDQSLTSSAMIWW